MNRQERRRAEKQGYNRKDIMDQTLRDVYKQGFDEGMKHIVNAIFYMTAYTINYKLGFGKKRLQEIMYAIFNNIDAYRTGHLTIDDYETIEKEMNELGVRIK